MLGTSYWNDATKNNSLFLCVCVCVIHSTLCFVSSILMAVLLIGWLWYSLFFYPFVRSFVRVVRWILLWAIFGHSHWSASRKESKKRFSLPHPFRQIWPSVNDVLDPKLRSFEMWRLRKQSKGEMLYTRKKSSPSKHTQGKPVWYWFCIQFARQFGSILSLSWAIDNISNAISCLCALFLFVFARSFLLRINSSENTINETDDVLIQIASYNSARQMDRYY